MRMIHAKDEIIREKILEHRRQNDPSYLYMTIEDEELIYIEESVYGISDNEIAKYIKELREYYRACDVAEKSYKVYTKEDYLFDAIKVNNDGPDSLVAQRRMNLFDKGYDPYESYNERLRPKKPIRPSDKYKVASDDIMRSMVHFIVGLIVGFIISLIAGVFVSASGHDVIGIIIVIVGTIVGGMIGAMKS